jgi:hypothetical protein
VPRAPSAQAIDSSPPEIAAWRCGGICTRSPSRAVVAVGSESAHQLTVGLARQKHDALLFQPSRASGRVITMTAS